MTKKYYAHSLPGKPPEEWQSLEAHLDKVAKLADEFARPFGGGSWSRLLGYNHDIGKSTFQWQAYLRHENQIVDDFSKYYTRRVKHAALGAQWLYEHSKEAGKLLAYCIAGHHVGLPNWVNSPESALKSRLEKNRPEIGIPLEIPDFLQAAVRPDSY